MIKRLRRKHGYRLRSILTLLRGFEQPFGIIALFLGKVRPGGSTVRLRHTGQQFRVRGRMDVWCLKETLIDDCYERYGYAIQPGWTVIDVGAGIGDFTVLAATKAQGGMVHAFEPYPESFALLEDNLALNQVPMAMPHQLAVTGQPSHLQLDTTAGDPLMIESVAVGDQPEAVPGTIASITLEEIAQCYDLLVIDLLKLDCEGGEYDILYHSPPSTLARVQRIVMEYHERTPPRTHLDLVTFLEAAGFMVETFPSPVHPHLIGYLRADRVA